MKALNTFKCISLHETIVFKHRPTFKQLHNMISTNCAWADRLSVVTQPRDISAAAWPAAALSCTIIRRTVSRNSWERKSKLQRTLAKIGSIFFAIWEWKANHWSLTWIISYYDTLRIDLGVASTFKMYVVSCYVQAHSDKQMEPVCRRWGWVIFLLYRHVGPLGDHGERTKIYGRLYFLRR